MWRCRSANAHIDLRKGEAYFDVAKDAARPFAVQAGSRRIVAVDALLRAP